MRDVKAIVVVLAAFVAFPAAAETKKWLTLGFSKHVEDRRYCEVHPGVVVEKRYTYFRAFLGMHQNSYCEASAVAGAAWMPLTYQYVSAGITAMGLTGYQESRVLFAGGLALSYDRKKEGADLVIVPGHLTLLRWRWAFQ